MWTEELRSVSFVPSYGWVIYCSEGEGWGRKVGGGGYTRSIDLGFLYV